MNIINVRILDPKHIFSLPIILFFMQRQSKKIVPGETGQTGDEVASKEQAQSEDTESAKEEKV